MPTPIIELQRRLTIVGAIRAGAERPADGRRPGARLESFRLTSPRRPLIEQAAQLYGGQVSPWTSPVGDEWQVYTAAPEIPVLVMPGYSLRQSYELWEGATKRTRLCDGIEEELTGGPCICEREGEDRCDLYTRLVVALPELDTVLGWRLITRGANAAHELPTMMTLIEAKSSGQAFVPARIRLDSRRGVKDGQVVRYVVPVVDLGAGYLELAAGHRPANHRLERAVSDAERPDAEPPSAKSFAGVAAVGTLTGERRHPPNLPPPPPEPSLATAQPMPTEPLPADEQETLDLIKSTMDASEVPDPTPAQTRKATAPQKTKLNVLVGKLRDGGHIQTASLYKAIGGLRDVPGPDLVMQVHGADSEGGIHWAPLRDELTRVEANKLIDWLERKKAQVGA